MPLLYALKLLHQLSGKQIHYNENIDTMLNSLDFSSLCSLMTRVFLLSEWRCFAYTDEQPAKCNGTCIIVLNKTTLTYIVHTGSCHSNHDFSHCRVLCVIYKYIVPAACLVNNGHYWDLSDILQNMLS